MQRFLVSIALWCGFALAVPFVWAQGDVSDEIIYLDKSRKEAKASGTITAENPGQVTIKRTTGPLSIPATDIIDIEYGLRAKLKLPYRNVMNKEKAALAADDTKRKALILDVIKGYRDLIPQMDDAKRAQVHTEYKICKLLHRIAEDDPKEVESAIAALEKFRKTAPTSWQILPVTRMLVGLQVKQEDWVGAAKTLDDLANTPGIDAAIKQECEQEGAQVLLKAKKFDQAKIKLQNVLKNLKPDSPEATRIKIALIQCNQVTSKDSASAEKELRALLAKLSDQGPDRDLKAAAYNILGDMMMASGKTRDAFWAYMFVDVEYNQDKAELKKALYNLWQLFEKEFKDEVKAKQYKERYQKAG
jgi:hypothetical protein